MTVQALTRIIRGWVVAGAALFIASRAGAQSITVSAGSTTSAAVTPGAKVTVPIVIDLSNAGSLNIAALQATLSWTPAVLSFDSIRVVTALGWSFTPNIAAAAAGSVSFAASNATALGATSTLANIYFTATGASGGSQVIVTPTSAGNQSGQSILTSVRPLAQDVCVGALVRWGDVNNTNTVDILDAQQIARFSVGLSVTNLTALLQRGDVNANGTIDILDAQQIARFSVGLSAAPRINTQFVPVATPSGVAITPATPQTLALGSSAQFLAAPSAGATNLTGCAPVTWTSNNTAAVVVNGTGYVSAVGSGSATLTAASSPVSAQVAVTVSVVPVASVTVALGAPAIQVGNTTTGTATTFDAANNILTGRPITWSSSNTAVATVNASTGVVTGVSAGTATIFATSGGITGQANLFVTTGPPATSVTVNLSIGTILTGATATATATAFDAGNNPIPGAPITWTSSNTAVASVNATTGVITGLSAGTSNIIGTTNGVSGQATVTVNPAPVASVTVTAGTVQVTQTLQASAVARDAANNILAGTAFSWSSSNTAVATVNAVSGLITGIATGTATIFATAGAITGQATVTVVAQTTVASVTVILASPVVQPGATTTATATARTSANAIIPGATFTWASSNTSVATVNPTTGLVTGVALGTASIMATSQGVTGQATVTIGAPVATVNVSLAASIQVGLTANASATTLDAGGATLNGRVITWSSSNTSIATVNATTGVVTAAAVGTVNISATSEGIVGQKSVSITPAPVASVSVTLGASTLNQGQTTTSSAVLRDANNNVLTGIPITWSSSNSAVATVNATTGAVATPGAGTVNIVATAGGVNGQAPLTVNVVPVAAVTVAVAPQAILVGASTTATATTLDASNQVLTGRTITWTSSNSAVATVNAAGAVTGVGPGAANIVASSGGVTGQSSLTVAVATTNEPTGMTFIDERPFNCAKVTACETGWAYSETYPNGLIIVVDSQAPRSPFNVGQQTYTPQLPGGSSPSVQERSFPAKKQLYVSAWMKLSSNFVGHPTGTNKLVHFIVCGGNRIYTMARGTGANTLRPSFGLQGLTIPYFDGVSQTATSVNLLPNVTANLNIIRGQWHRWEVHLTANSDNAADARVIMWIDGVRVLDFSGIQFCPVNANWIAVQFSPTWGGGGGTITANFDVRMDALYISTK